MSKQKMVKIPASRFKELLEIEALLKYKEALEGINGRVKFFIIEEEND